MFPEKAAEFSRRFGLFLFEADRVLPREQILEKKTIVLIHGLDDPGKVRMNLAPELAREDYNVLLKDIPMISWWWNHPGFFSRNCRNSTSNRRHLSMIRNITSSSKHVPSAVPVIVGYFRGEKDTTKVRGNSEK